MVFCGLYPVESDRFTDLREGLSRLQLNDAALAYEPETSAALGFGFRCGFLGLLHSEIVQERLEREFDLDLDCYLSIGCLPANPGGWNRHSHRESDSLARSWKHLQGGGALHHGDDPGPQPVHGCLHGPFCSDRRGTFSSMESSGTNRVVLQYQLPLAEILLDFFDTLKSRTRGYASFDYDFLGYREGKLVKLDIRINSEPVDALSFITHRDRAFPRGKALVGRLKTVLPRQLFEIRVQASWVRR